MMHSPNPPFLKKYYPLILIAIGSFLLLFPFGLVSSSDSLFYVWGIIGFITLVSGVLSYYKKKATYSSSLRKKMKIAGILFLASLMAIPLIGVGMGVVVGFSSVFYNSSLHSDTRDIDSVLLQTRVVDWVNTNRAENNVGGVNLNENLNSLSKKRSLDISRAPADKVELISDLDVNEIAKNNSLECIIDGDSFNIHEYTLLIPHSKFRTIEELVDFVMGFLIDQGIEKEKIFASNMTRTGINVSTNNEYLIVVQNFC